MTDLVFVHYVSLFQTLVMGVWLGQTFVIHLSGNLVFQGADDDSGSSLCAIVAIKSPGWANAPLVLFSFDCLQPVVRAAGLEPIFIAYLTFQCLVGLKYLFYFNSVTSLYSYNTVLAICEHPHDVQVGIPLSWHVNVRTPSRYSVFFMNNFTAPLWRWTESSALPGEV